MSIKPNNHALDRVTQVTSTHFDKLSDRGSVQATSSVTDFVYDKAGNNQHHNAKYNTKNNQLLEDDTYTYTYDNRGNLKGKVNKHIQAFTYYSFNTLNQLTKVYTVDTNNNVTHYLKYSYDALGRRVSKEENTVKHCYLYDNNHNIIAILDANQNHLATIVHHPHRVDTPLSITNINGTFYYHRDHQGSIIALTDSEGNIVEEITYDNAYGKVNTHSIKEENLTLNPYGYTGREMDASDLYYYRARYYDPNTQRFLSKDPIEFEAGDFNFYRYVGGDPLNFVDPSGLILLQLGGVLLGGVVGGAFEYFNQTGPTNWGRVFVAAGSGAVAGLATSVGGAMALGALAGGGNNAYQQLDNNDPCKTIDPTEVVGNMIGGAVGAKLGDVIGGIGKNILKNPVQRATRQFIPGAHPNGANYGTTGAVIGAAAGESAGSKTGNTIDHVTDEYYMDDIIVTSDDCSKPCQ